MQAAINAARGVLPQGMPSPPTYSKVNPADTPILTLPLTLIATFGVMKLAGFSLDNLSLTLTPMLCSRFLRAEADSAAPGAFSRACERGYEWLLGHYENVS